MVLAELSPRSTPRGRPCTALPPVASASQPQSARWHPMAPDIPLSLALGNGMLLVTPRSDSVPFTPEIVPQAKTPISVPTTSRHITAQAAAVAASSNRWHWAMHSLVAPNTTNLQQTAQALLTSTTTLDQPLRAEAPMWWNAPPEAVAAANDFDGRRERLQREARLALRTVSGIGGPDESRIFERHLLEVRRQRYVPPHFAKEKTFVQREQRSNFNVYRSIWAPRVPWSDGKDVYDTEQVMRKRFEVDFGNLLSLGIAKHISKNDKGDAEQSDVPSCAEALWQNYATCCQIFTYYASMYGEINFLTLNAWTLLLEDCRLVDSSSQFCKRANMDTVFIIVDNMEHAAEKEKSRHAGSRTDRQKALSRVEFLATLIHIATNKYVLTGKESRVSSALKRMLTSDVLRSIPRGPRADADSFRRAHCYTAEVTNVLKKHEPTLRTIFAGLATISNDYKKLSFTFKTWTAFLQYAGITGPDLALREAILCFAWSRMAVIDGRSRAGEHKESVLPFEGFMEAIVRMAVLKALPTETEIAEAGVAHAGVYLAQMRDNDASAYSAFVEQRACAWGEKPDLLQPVHRCVEYTIAILVYQIKVTVEGPSADVSLRERVMNKLVATLNGKRQR